MCYDRGVKYDILRISDEMFVKVSNYHYLLNSEIDSSMHVPEIVYLCCLCISAVTYVG